MKVVVVIAVILHRIVKVAMGMIMYCFPCRQMQVVIFIPGAKKKKKREESKKEGTAPEQQRKILSENSIYICMCVCVCACVCVQLRTYTHWSHRKETRPR